MALDKSVRIIYAGALLAFASTLSAQFLAPALNNTTYSGGTSPVSVVAGRFDSASTIPGLAVANNASNSVTVLFGMPQGGFTPQAAALPNIASPGSIAVGDFNGDGNVDLAITSQTQGNVTIFLLDGTGKLKAMSGPFPVGQSPSAIAVGSFSGGEFLDLAVINRKSNNLTVLKGDGKGGFTPVTPITVGKGPSSLAPGDFNNDGYQDLAIANELDNTVTVLLGSPTGLFNPAVASPFPVGFNPSSVATGDFNADGNLDFVVANSGSNNVMLLLGNGLGGFTQAPGGPISTGTEPVALAVGDFNGDSFLDLAVANFTSNNITVLLGSGKGSFSPGPGSPFASGGTNPISIAIGDFNQDGAPDLAIANNGSANITIGLNGTIPTLSMVSAASYAQSVALSSIVSIFGSDVPSTVIPASSSSSTCLNGVSVRVTDSSGATGAPLTLFYAGPGQINALLPQSAATGTSRFALYNSSDPKCLTSPSAPIETGSVMLTSVAPGLFSANASGKGVALAQFDVGVPSTQGSQAVYNCPKSGACYAVPIDVSSGTAALVLYGTGIRNRAALTDVTVAIGAQMMLPVFYAGPVPGVPGLDQVNVLLPSSLTSTGVVYVSVSVGTTSSNQVTLCFTNPGDNPPLCSPL